ncbi:MAG: hypothetical protein M3463_20705, partial [Verrucomicrobiota bacterium]|nr:hypothetical protein [Verrucomicrobiota bacterium]
GSVHSKCLWSWVVVLVNTTSKPSTEAHFELFFASARKNHACLGSSRRFYGSADITKLQIEINPEKTTLKKPKRGGIVLPNRWRKLAHSCGTLRKVFRGA